MVQLTKNVFTPAKMPTVTGVNRGKLSTEMDTAIRQGGFFISVLGTTKLGKTTLVKSATKKIDCSIFLNGHSLKDGAEAIWQKLGAELEIPVSRETGTVSADKSTWGFFAKFSSSLGGLLKGEGGSQVGGEHLRQISTVNATQLDAETEVIKALELLIDNDLSIAVTIDDFHFITDVNVRRSLIKALRPVAFAGVSIVLITLPNRETDVAFNNTNIGGRHKFINVPRWSEDELEKIAVQGFQALNVYAEKDTIERLAQQSYGSPQIMQQLCLSLCEDVNGIQEGFKGGEPYPLKDPHWWTFFSEFKDYQSEQWLQRLVNGPKGGAHQRKTYPLGAYDLLDGYQLIFFVLRDKMAPPSITLSELKEAVGLLLYKRKDHAGRYIFDSKRVNAMNLDGKARNLHVLAHRIIENQSIEVSDGTEFLGEDPVLDDETIEIAGEGLQPVLEYVKDPVDPILNILDPQLCYTLMWHGDKYLGSREDRSVSRFD